ncbi:MAG: histidine kinase [Bacteroidia bacterium]
MMLLENYFKDKFKNVWIRCNVQYTIVGLIIGTVLNIFFNLFNRDIGLRSIAMTYVVSVVITLCITNISIINEHLIKKRFRSPIINLVLNYALTFLGVAIGTFISFGFVILLYGVPFSEINAWQSLKFNATIGFVVGTIIYLYQLQRDNYKLQLDEQELQLSKLNELKTQADLKTLQARINPHFLYNSLNSIASLIHDDADKAEEMTIKLSQLFRYTINTQDANWVTVKEELEIVRTYLDIERVRFGNRIIFNVDADASIMNEMIPRFLLQPLVENALKHGLKNKSDNGKLSVSVKDKNDYIELSIHDNGIPFPAEMAIGYGLQSTYDKLNLLYKENYKVKINNDGDKNILIELPKKPKA